MANRVATCSMLQWTAPATKCHTCTSDVIFTCTRELRRLQYSADCTTPLSPEPGKTPLHGRRFVYGYSLNGSDFPCYLLWPIRTLTASFCLLESQTRRYVDIEHAGFLHPLGLRHFCDGFSLRAEVSIRSSALVAFQFQEEEVSPDGVAIKNNLLTKMHRRLIDEMFQMM